MGITVTPNIGLQIPAYDQANWQVQFNYDLNLLDLIFGGAVTVPALNVTTLTAGNISGIALPPSTAEVPSGAVPGTTYTLSYVPNPVAMLFFFLNGQAQPASAYTLVGAAVVLNNPTSAGDTVYARYFHS